MSEEQATEVSVDAEVAQSGADWRESIPEEIRDHKSLSHISDIGALAKSYVHAQSMIGADKVVIPGKSATPEEWGEFYGRLGRPEDPGSYGLETTDEMNGDMVDWFRQTAHAAGLTERQAAQIFGSYNEFAANMQQGMTVDREQMTAQVEADLRKEFGQACEDRLAQGLGVVENFGNPELMETQLADGSLLGDNPEFIRLMATVGNYMQEALGEDTLEGIRTSGAMTPQDAQEKVSELRAPNSPYWDQRHPEHHHYVNEVNRYMEMIHG